MGQVFEYIGFAAMVAVGLVLTFAGGFMTCFQHAVATRFEWQPYALLAMGLVALIFAFTYAPFTIKLEPGA